MKKIINPWEGMEGYFCFGCAPNNESGLKMEFYEDGDEIVSTWVPEARFQGWLNTLHGGIQATLLDEICAWVIARKLQTAGVTSRMETQYLKPIHTTDSHLTSKEESRRRSGTLCSLKPKSTMHRMRSAPKPSAPISFSQEKKQKRKCTSKAVIRKKKRNLYKFDSKSEFFLINICFFNSYLIFLSQQKNDNYDFKYCTSSPSSLPNGSHGRLTTRAVTRDKITQRLAVRIYSSVSLFYLTL